METLQQGFDSNQPIDNKQENVPKEENIDRDVKELLSYNTLLRGDEMKNGVEEGGIIFWKTHF